MSDGEDSGLPQQGQQPSVEEAEERLRGLGALSDSTASFAGPEDQGAARRRRGRAERDDWGGQRSWDQTRSSGSSTMRLIVRIVVPIVFLAGVLALAAVVVKSGILGGEPVASPSPTVSPTGPQVGERTYKIEKGDTLSQIAGRFGVGVDDLLAANPDLDMNNLAVGEKITIPPPD